MVKPVTSAPLISLMKSVMDLYLQCVDLGLQFAVVGVALALVCDEARAHHDHN